MSRAHSLHRLQEIDLSLDRRQERIDQILAMLEDDQEIRRASEILSEIEVTLYEKRQAVKNAEYAVEAQREKINETEKALYGGSISNPKELQDLNQEADSLKRYLSTLEDRLLDEMVDLEQIELDYKAASETLEMISQRREIEKTSLLEEKARLLVEIDQLAEDRKAALASVEENDLEIYQKLRQRYDGLAVALLEGGNCNICGLSISASRQQIIKSGKELVQCKQCRRILYAG